MPKAKYIGNPAFRVHTHEGELLRATSGKLTSTKPATFRIKADPAVAPHAEYVIRGTRVMLPRDVIWSTLSAPGTRKEFMKAAVRTLGKALRSQAVVRFTPDPAGSYRLTILAMENTAVSMHAAAVVTAAAVGERGLELVKHNMSMKDHTLADLAAMDHPYARRHGSIKIHN